MNCTAEDVMRDSENELSNCSTDIFDYNIRPTVSRTCTSFSQLLVLSLVVARYLGSRQYRCREIGIGTARKPTPVAYCL
jgi:hypothetical protein